MHTIIRFIKNNLNDFNDTSFLRLFRLFSFLALLIITYGFVFSGFQIIDEFEHLHASWLIFEGKLPYRDFLEHHNPLLWYISAPIVGLFYDNAIIFYVMRIISSIASVITLYYLYKISMFIGNRVYAWLSVAIFLGNIITVYNFYQYRPDNFMNLCFIAGIYYLFCYVKNPQIQSLIFSFLAFCFSALFLQKIVLLLIVISLILLFLIYKKQLLIKDFIVATIPAILVAITFVSYLYYHDLWNDYIRLNLNFNMDLVYYCGRASFWLQSIFFSIYGFTLLTCLLFFKRENIFFRVLSVIFIAEFIMRNFYFSPHPNYYTLITMLSALILPVWLKNYGYKYKCISILFIILSFIYLGYLFNTVERTSQRHNSLEHYKMADFIHKNSSKNDVLINGYDKAFNIYRKDASYYWFNVEMLLPIFIYKYDLGRDYNLNNLIIEHKPKFLYIEDFVNLTAFRLYGETKYIQRYNSELIKQFYKPTQFKNLVILK